jgi:hypothetical protein
MSKYVWCEDSGSGFAFWNIFFSFLNPDIIVQSKQNNTGLRKAVAGIIDDNENQYYILADNALDNPDILREIKKINEMSQRNKNIKMIKIHSFEFVILSFEMLEDWVFASQDELREKRKDLLFWKRIFVRAYVNEENADILNEVKAALQYSDKHNSEQVSAKLLFDITRNTGFETNKGTLGQCFVVDCCNWQEKQHDDICGLDGMRLSLANKMMSIYEKSVLKNALEEAGFENDNSI